MIKHRFPAINLYLFPKRYKKGCVAIIAFNAIRFIRTATAVGTFIDSRSSSIAGCRFSLLFILGCQLLIVLAYIKLILLIVVHVLHFSDICFESAFFWKFGFSDEGVSDKSTHGNVVWHQMRLAFWQVTPIKMVDFIIYSFYNYFIKRVQRGT